METPTTTRLTGRFNDRRRDENTTNSLNTTIQVFTLNLVHRYPNVDNIETITVDELERIANFSILTSEIITDVWERTCRERRRAA